MRSWHGAAVTALVTAFVLTFLGVPATAQAVDAIDAWGGVEERPCPVAMPSGTTCGFLLVPERRDVPNSRTIKVGFAVRRATPPSGDSEDPVVFTGGGPGSPSSPLTGLLAGMFPDRDVVVIEQRGGRYSEPRLSCPEIARGMVATLTAPPKGTPTDTPKDTQKDTQKDMPEDTGEAGDGAATEIYPGILDEAEACLVRLQREGVDLRGYRTAEIAGDVVDLRRALGYQRWNLFGVGYSTRPTLRAAALDPEGTRAVVLDSFPPAEAKRYDDAAPNLAATIAKLGGTARFAAMVTRFNAVPAVFDTRDPINGRRISLRLTGDDVATLVEEALHDADLVPIVPALVDGLADGRTGLLRPLVDRMGERLTSRDWGLYYAVQCQDEAPFNDFPGDARPRLSAVVADAAVCGAWRLPPSRNGWAQQDAAAQVAAPVLVVGGQLDPAAPPESAGRTAAALPGARFTEFAGVGHAVFLSSDCGRRTIAAFFDDPASTGAAACEPGKAPRPLVRPGDVLLTPSAYQATVTPALLAPGVVFVIVAAVQLLAGLVAPVRRAARNTARRRGAPAALSVLAGLAGVAFGGLSALDVSGRAEPAMLAIGVPPAVAWYGLLIVVATVLSGIEAFRLHARAVRIVPVLTGLACLAWFYGWLVA
ncbi:alpha/beta fold hydrolase [Sphaerimonospora thailandensis]|uniref:TAP-like protein n=1 Tax=Sphaerimonospora thailandensis TaxID=795644 RepID=A0A8J3R6P6_9ACTN|nr:alpha/beta fold hydrolase [Sphaerimonospora thailandensis]GIH69355.1 hypothetical protein Mth01_16080 [Sphaerimonospora thailandensis]